MSRQKQCELQTKIVAALLYCEWYDESKQQASVDIAKTSNSKFLENKLKNIVNICLIVVFINFSQILFLIFLLFL
jgi:hypothetical protein